MKNEIKVGQIVYSEKGQEVLEWEVTKIGRKYFYVKNSWWEKKVDFEELRYEDKDYTQHNIQFYLTREEINLKNENNSLLRELSNQFSNSYYHTKKVLTLDQIRRIHKIINE